MLGFVGAGFVYRYSDDFGEWFPANRSILPNAFTGAGVIRFSRRGDELPTICINVCWCEGWRYAVALTGFDCIDLCVIYYNRFLDTEKASTYFKPKNPARWKSPAKRF